MCICLNNTRRFKPLSTLLGLGFLIRTVVHPHFRCSLEMPLTLTVKYVNELLILSLPNTTKFYLLLTLLAWVQYAIFGKVTKGDETLKKLEELPTRREGIFVMVRFHFNCFNILMSMVDFSFLQNWYRTLFLTWYLWFERKIRRGVGGNSGGGGWRWPINFLCFQPSYTNMQIIYIELLLFMCVYPLILQQVFLQGNTSNSCFYWEVIFILQLSFLF